MGRSLKTYQEEVIKKAGLVLVDVPHLSAIPDERFLSFDDDLIFTAEFVSACKKLTQDRKNNAEFIFNPNTFNDRYLFSNKKDICLNFKYRNKKSSEWDRLIIEQKVYENFIRVPPQIYESGHYHFDQCEVWAARVSSPFHLLYANLALNFGRSIGAQKIMPAFLRERFFPNGSRGFYWALKKMNKMGKGCKIHKTAVLEGVELGDDVTIGANCVVRMSKIESGTTVEDNVTLNYSLIGKNNYISANNFINLCMTYHDVYLIHGPYQFSIYGSSVAVMAVINCDFRLDKKTIVIPTNQGLIDSGQTLLGIAYGHGSVVGGGNIIAPGRIVPNGIKITPPGNIIISKFDGYA